MSQELVVINKTRLTDEQEEMKKSIQNREFEEINKKMRKAKGFGIDKADTWKVETHYAIQNNQNGFILFGDINNLSQANKMLGKGERKTGEEIADQYIKQLIHKQRQILEEHEIDNYTMGKMGDEIYIYIPGEVEHEKIQQINQEYNHIKAGPLSISFGYADQLTQGLEEAVKIAEEMMLANKMEKKQKNIGVFLGVTEPELEEQLVIQMTEQAIKATFDKLRILSSEVGKYEKQADIEEKFREAIQVATKKKDILKERIKKDYQASQTEKRDPIYEQIEEEEKKLVAHPEIQLTEEEKKEYILSKVLTHTPVKGIQKKEYYNTIGYKKDLKLFGIIDKPKQLLIHEMKNTQMLTFDLSGIKYINDNYSHGQCDEVVIHYMEEVRRILEEENGIKIKNMVVDGIANYYVLIEKGKQENMQEAMIRNTRN